MVQQDIKNWLDGDDTAYRSVFDAFYPKLFQTCLKIVKRREESEEMVMDVFLKIWQRRHALGHVENFESYLFQSLRNQIGDYNRKKVLKVQQIEGLPDEVLGSTPHPEFGYKELEEIYHQSVARLSEKQREVFLMSREEGLSQKEIAEKRNLSPSTVNNHISAAIKILRNDLGKYSDVVSILVLLFAMQL